MTTFIRLHTSDGEPIYINPAYIVSIRRDTSRYTPTLTDVETTNKEFESVMETVDEVLDRIYREGRE